MAATHPNAGPHIGVLQQFYYFPHHLPIPPHIPPPAVPQTPPASQGQKGDVKTVSETPKPTTPPPDQSTSTVATTPTKTSTDAKVSKRKCMFFILCSLWI